MFKWLEKTKRRGRQVRNGRPATKQRRERGFGHAVELAAVHILPRADALIRSSARVGLDRKP